MFATWNARAVGLSLDASQTVDIAAIAGFEGVDLLVRDLVESGEDPRAIRSRMDALGLKGGAWPLPVHWRGDVRRFEADLRALPGYARVAAELGVLRTGTWVWPQIEPEHLGSGATVDRAREAVAFHIERLGRIARILDDHGSRLGLEVIGPRLARKEGAEEFIGGYGPLVDLLGELRERHPNVGMLLDAFHLHAAGEEIATGLQWGVDRVVWVHVADASKPNRAHLRDEDRVLPGETGWGEAKRLLRTLAERGYRGPITAEPLGHCQSLAGLEPVEAARRTMGAFRTVLPGRHERP